MLIDISRGYRFKAGVDQSCKHACGSGIIMLLDTCFWPLKPRPDRAFERVVITVDVLRGGSIGLGGICLASRECE